MERECPRTLAAGRLGWYVAADLQSHEERDWRLDFAVEAGLLTHSDGRRFRVGVRYVNGRPPLVEFFQDTEQWLTLGVWMDL